MVHPSVVELAMRPWRQGLGGVTFGVRTREATGLDLRRLKLLVSGHRPGWLALWGLVVLGEAMMIKRESKLAVAALLASAAVCASPAMAFPGPDVIVGDLPDISNYTNTGAVTGKRAYSVGTVSCNIGTSTLKWIANTNEHPVIGQTMYRLSNGRFEQIGQSWLKHGFTALQGTVCSACTAHPNGTALGVGCSDPYGSGLNGSQGNLGPKSEVNATTGFYPYPYVNQGVGAGALFKRIIVNETDLTTAGALYFVGGMYVTRDDATSGNHYNNQSYRRVTVGAAPAMDLTLQGPTVRARQAIYAWQDHGLGVNLADPGVAITFAQAPNDGRFLVGSRVRSIGTGVWRYEIAIQNENSHRSGGSFRIPLPAGAVVSNVGFHDVEYHSGEPFNSTDWAVTVSSSEIRWDCVTPYNASNDTGNALRWDTIYNFWFDCNMPAETGSGTIGLYKPGAQGEPDSIPAGIRVPSPNGNTRPDNDDYLFATPIGGGTTSFTTVGATTDGQVETTCSAGGVTNDVWFRYTAATAGDTTISLCGSAFDTKMYLYAGAANPTNGSATPIACNDDDPLCPTGDARQSRITFLAVAGQSYLIRVGGKNGATGEGSVFVTTPPTGPQIPANDPCAGAAWIGDSVPLAGTLQLATNDGTASCGNSTTSPDVWFKYKPQVGGVIRFDSCGSNFDTNIAVFTGSCGGLTQVACNDDAQTGSCAGTDQSLAAIVGVANTTYLVRLSSYNGQRGNFTFRATGGQGVVPPANDECTGRFALNAGTTAFTTVAASGTASDPCTGQTLASDVWYNVNVDANTASRVAIYTTNASFDARLALYSGAGCANIGDRLIGCADGSGNNANISRVFSTNTNYTLRIGGNAAAGTGNVNVVVTCPFDLDDGTGNGIPDNAVTIDDLLFYLSAFEAGSPAADLDNGSGNLVPDGAVTIDDLLVALGRFESGC